MYLVHSAWTFITNTESAHRNNCRQGKPKLYPAPNYPTAQWKETKRWRRDWDPGSIENVCLGPDVESIHIADMHSHTYVHTYINTNICVYA